MTNSELSALLELKRRMQAVRVQNFYGSIIRDALAAIDALQDENIALRAAAAKQGQNEWLNNSEAKGPSAATRSNAGSAAAFGSGSATRSPSEKVGLGTTG